jgi:hypothetical protein
VGWGGGVSKAPALLNAGQQGMGGGREVELGWVGGLMLMCY